MQPYERSSREWFSEAKRCYSENHQGCPWCSESYTVRIAEAQKTKYSCQNCDFQASYDPINEIYHWVPGENLVTSAPETMLEI